jgi:hypothetical protein
MVFKLSDILYVYLENTVPELHAEIMCSSLQDKTPGFECLYKKKPIYLHQQKVLIFFNEPSHRH